VPPGGGVVAPGSANPSAPGGEMAPGGGVVEPALSVPGGAAAPDSSSQRMCYFLAHNEKTDVDLYFDDDAINSFTAVWVTDAAGMKIQASQSHTAP
jgi:hypothetical protein